MLMVEMCPNWPWSIYNRSTLWCGWVFCLDLFRWGLEITEWSYTMEADLRASKSSKTGWITSGPAWTRPTAASGVRLFGPEPGWNESDLNHKLHGSCGMGPQLTWVALPSANLLRRLIESHPITTLTVFEFWWQNMAGMTWIWDCDMYGWCIRLSVARMFRGSTGAVPSQVALRGPSPAGRRLGPHL